MQNLGIRRKIGNRAKHNEYLSFASDTHQMVRTNILLSVQNLRMATKIGNIVKNITTKVSYLTLIRIVCQNSLWSVETVRIVTKIGNIVKPDIVGETNNLKSGDRFNHKSLRLERTRSNVFLEFRLRRISISNLSNGVHR